MGKMTSGLLLSLVAIGWFIACGPGEPAQAPAPTATPAPPPVPEPTAEPSAEPEEPKEYEPPAKAAPITTTGAPPPATAGDYELSPSDCSRLSSHYEKLLRREKMAELNAKNLKPKVRERAKEQVLRTIEQGHQNWVKQCGGIVGTVQIKSRITCARNSDSIKRFHGCIDGLHDNEPAPK